MPILINPFFRRLFCLVSILFFSNSWSNAGDGKTTHYTRILSMATENDSYALNEERFLRRVRYGDRYYTNGFFISLGFMKNNLVPDSIDATEKKVVKKIVHYELGQRLYSPYKAIVRPNEFVDRPFAGYLYGGVKFNFFFNNESMLEFQGNVGVLGPASLGEETQRLAHSLTDFTDVRGWEEQIRNEPILNLSVKYFKGIAYILKKRWDIHAVFKQEVGNFNISSEVGLSSRFGIFPLRPIYDSDYLKANASVHQKVSKHEFFFFVQPSVIYTLRDASVQGGVINQTSPVTGEIIPFRFQLKTGLMFSIKNFTLSLYTSYITKEVENQVYENHTFAAVELLIKFKRSNPAN